MFGLPKKQPKTKIDYISGIPTLTIIYPTGEERHTRILFNQAAVEAMNLSEEQTAAFSFLNNNVYVANLDAEVADGKTYLELYRNREFAGIYMYSKAYADAICNHFNIISTSGLISVFNFKLTAELLNGVNVYQLSPISEFTEVMNMQSSPMGESSAPFQESSDMPSNRVLHVVE